MLADCTPRQKCEHGRALQRDDVIHNSKPREARSRDMEGEEQGICAAGEN